MIGGGVGNARFKSMFLPSPKVFFHTEEAPLGFCFWLFSHTLIHSSKKVKSDLTVLLSSEEDCISKRCAMVPWELTTTIKLFRLKFPNRWTVRYFFWPKSTVKMC